MKRQVEKDMWFRSSQLYFMSLTNCAKEINLFHLVIKFILNLRDKQELLMHFLMEIQLTAVCNDGLKVVRNITSSSSFD